MARIQTDFLRGLWPLFRPPGGLRSPGDIELEQPITLVHNIRDDAANEAGFVLERMNAVTASVSTTERSQFLRSAFFLSGSVVEAELEGRGLKSSTTDVYLLSVGMTVGDANLTVAGHSVIFGGRNSDGTQSHTLQIADGRWGTAAIIAGEQIATTWSGSPVSLLELPVLLPLGAGTAVNYLVVAGGGGATSVRFLERYLFQPAGLRPPFDRV